MQKQLAPFVASERDRARIEHQVEQVLAHQLFRLSKRLPAFLIFVVRESLNQDAAFPPKERRIGVEVFGRRPDYDTNADPIVRVTATELRKKLAQYYYSDGREDGIRIELLPGSYLPRFLELVAVEEPEVQSAEMLETPASLPPEEELLGLPAEETVPPPLASPNTPPAPARSRSLWRASALTLGVVLLAALAGYVPLLRRLQPTAVDLFWKEILQSNNHVTIVMPVIQRHDPPDATRPADASVAPNLSIEDTTIASHVAAQLGKVGASYWLASSSEISFGELRTGPAVLIGALDNVWTMRLCKELPFVFQESGDGHTGQIIEAGSGTARRTWALDITTPHGRIAHDYGILARFQSKLTGEPVVIIAGISSQGTQAAGEILSRIGDPAAKLDGLRHAGNFGVVVETDAVDGKAGMPHIVAERRW